MLLVCFRLQAQDEEITDYEPYSADEFPSWLHDIRRAEVIAVGSFPISMLFVSLTYEGVRAIINAATGAETSGGPAFGSGDLSPEERRGILFAGTLLSVAVALTDYLIGLIGAPNGE